MFELITEKHKAGLKKIVKSLDPQQPENAADALHKFIEQVRSDIPKNKRVSYGRYSVLKKTGPLLYRLLQDRGISVTELASSLFENTEIDPFVRGLGVQLISIEAIETGNCGQALSVFEKAAANESWGVRECSAGVVRKLIKSFPDVMRRWYISMAESEDPKKRRFAVESIRPVADNPWLKTAPEFCFVILEKLYTETDAYPRTSVGNSLSDWARKDKERVFAIVKDLINSENKDSYWIAYRACRNLVKKESKRVMDILKTDEYKYKKRTHRREDNKGK
ncbi:MAG: hypothetical protein ACLFR1_15465 [Spirochaetia bacterium]